eukprot:CAMPEP_0174833094 /NCGR_PEP_ID=MMETSP1114-20130205/4031_1 /TAXON_ID=312471 /ORGANISM="Neobodo designis, Strain CCAP 1951/1" /LENGTH=208 /DNA_ID=CAMNT_0016066965 /DNA_START=54 /DNA_END=681 /DNA_ORIENTATION=-
MAVAALAAAAREGGGSITSIRDLRRTVGPRRGAAPAAMDEEDLQPRAPSEPSRPSPRALRPHNATDSPYSGRVVTLHDDDGASDPMPTPTASANLPTPPSKGPSRSPRTPLRYQLSASERMYWWQNLRDVLRIQRWMRRTLAQLRVRSGAASRKQELDAEYKREAAEMIQRGGAGGPFPEQFERLPRSPQSLNLPCRLARRLKLPVRG